MLKGQRLCTALAVCAMVVLVSSCSRPPSNDTIISAISDHLKKYVPPSLSGSVMGCDKAQIELIEIKEIGKFHDQPRWWEEAKYWPVKAHVKGTCQGLDLFSPAKRETKDGAVVYKPNTKTKTFDRVVVFKLYQDDFGKWKASD